VIVAPPVLGGWNSKADRRYTLGAEEKVMLLEPFRWSYAQAIDSTLSRVPDELAPGSSRETHAGVVELVTGHGDEGGVVDEPLIPSSTLKPWRTGAVCDGTCGCGRLGTVEVSVTDARPTIGQVGPPLALTQSPASCGRPPRTAVFVDDRSADATRITTERGG